MARTPALAGAERGWYRVLPTAEWEAPGFQALPRAEPCARYLLRYLQLGPHTTCIPGLFRLGILSAAEALDWTAAEVESMVQVLERAGLIVVDRQARLMFLPGAFDLDPASSSLTVKGWRAVFRQLPACELKRTAGAHLLEKLAQEETARVARFAAKKKPLNDMLLVEAGVFLKAPYEGVSDTPSHTRTEANTQDPTPKIQHPRASASAAPTAAAGELFEVPASKAAKATKTEVPEHEALKEHWFAGYRARNTDGAEPVWDGGDGKTCKRALKSLGLDGAKAHLDRYFARHDGDDFWRGKGLGFKSAFSTETINKLHRAALTAAPAKRGWVPLTGTSERFKNIADDSAALGLDNLVPVKPKEAPRG